MNAYHKNLTPTRTNDPNNPRWSIFKNLDKERIESIKNKMFERIKDRRSKQIKENRKK